MRRSPPRSPDAEAAQAVGDYARAVVAGEIVANRDVGLACRRHLADVETGRERGLRFDENRAGRAIRFGIGPYGMLGDEEANAKII